MVRTYRTTAKMGGKKQEITGNNKTTAALKQKNNRNINKNIPVLYNKNNWNSRKAYKSRDRFE